VKVFVGTAWGPVDVCANACACCKCTLSALLLDILVCTCRHSNAIVQACASERNTFCAEVATGNARVFRCLVQNLGKPDFGSLCRDTIIRKLQRRQQNWKLDVNLRNACKEDANTLCGDVDHDSDRAEMARCLMRKHDELSDWCLREVCKRS
jgi:Cysteine rich repeat